MNRYLVLFDAFFFFFFLCTLKSVILVHKRTMQYRTVNTKLKYNHTVLLRCYKSIPIQITVKTFVHHFSKMYFLCGKSNVVTFQLFDCTLSIYQSDQVNICSLIVHCPMHLSIIRERRQLA